MSPRTPCRALFRFCPLLFFVCLAGSAWHAALLHGAENRFIKSQLDGKFRSEGVAVGDFNKDGQKDIAAGSVWFEGPLWKPHVVLAEAKEFDPLGYSNSFCNFVEDLNKDGWDDLIVVDFPGAPTWWYENPQKAGGPWKQHQCVAVTNNESPDFLDVDGDGVRELLQAFCPDAAQPDGESRFMAIVKRGVDVAAPWNITRVSSSPAPATTKFSHGLGLGDINLDGRKDVLCPEGWWEQPASEGSGEWKFHQAPFGEACAHMHVYDFDGDGDADVASSSAHQLGVWWHEQTQEGWKTHLISDLFSQTHSLVMTDMNGDGLPDLVTGKRWWAHGPKGDASPEKDPVVYWFELSRQGGKPQWTPHLIANECGVGTQFEVTDVNQDGLLDVVTSNKRGVFYLEQQKP